MMCPEIGLEKEWQRNLDDLVWVGNHLVLSDNSNRQQISPCAVYQDNTYFAFVTLTWHSKCGGAIALDNAGTWSVSKPPCN